MDIILTLAFALLISPAFRLGFFEGIIEALNKK
jgi:hypothetical protein